MLTQVFGLSFFVRFFFRFLCQFLKVFGRVLEPFWSGFGAQNRWKNPSRNASIFQVVFSSIFGGFLSDFWTHFRMEKQSENHWVGRAVFIPFFTVFSKSRTASPNPATLDPFENSRIIRGVRFLAESWKYAGRASEQEARIIAKPMAKSIKNSSKIWADFLLNFWAIFQGFGDAFWPQNRRSNHRQKGMEKVIDFWSHFSWKIEPK